ncbi:MAG: PLP-dependent aminotransferase family protein [Acidobacteria bacterium]|nr:PLP-dependent aminotransferase family protein [Acidobacteriota bacterium]
MSTPWIQRYAQRTQRMTSSAIRELLKLIAQPDIISFAGGLPAPELFPVEEIREAVETVLTRKGAQALQYSTTEGYPPLRDMLVRHMKRYGIVVDIDNVLITSGSQQALDLIGKILINPGDKILTEHPTYLGAIQAFTMYGADYVTVPIDDDGVVPASLEVGLRAGPKFMYLLPNFQNPTGVTISADRRRELVLLADRYGIPIVEDDPYGQLRYEGDHIKPLVVIDAEVLECQHNGKYSGNVIYMSTFSKTLAPGLRLGWIVAPKEVIYRLVQAKQGTDLHTSSFDQMVAYEVGRGGFIDRHVQRIREVYGNRLRIMLDALAKAFPDPSAGVRWTRPQGGLFLWIELPDWMDSAELLKTAVKEKVAFVPGAPFYPVGGGHNTMRLNFSYGSEAMIEEGIARLGRVVNQRIALQDGAVRAQAEQAAT